MGGYIAVTPQERGDMLAQVGVDTLEDLFLSIPQGARLDRPLNLPEGLSEFEVQTHMRALADQNTRFPSVFRGAGAYRHFVPAIVGAIAGKETFVTAYTPYQAEISQGVLQAIFEYQTMICELTGMDASNASVYDGAWAAAEAVGMCRERKRDTVLVSLASHPQIAETLATYCQATGFNLKTVPAKNGLTDLDALAGLMDDTVCCLYAQQIAFTGGFEDAAALASAVHGAGGRLILGVNPIAAALLQSAREAGADIAVGDGQPLGLPMAFGGPSLGFMATTQALTRRLPGRIVGQTHDAQGRRAFVLTLQAREQHIRREKAASNICSNQALCALTAAVYLSAMGPEGLRRAAQGSMAAAHYLADQLCQIPGFQRVHEGPFFHEFVTTCPVAVDALMARLEAKGILGGLPVPQGILWCATEVNTQAHIDTLIAAVKEVVPCS